MRVSRIPLLVLGLAWFAACTPQTPAESPGEAPTDAPAEEAAPPPAPAEAPAESEESAPPKEASNVPEPQFPPDASVDAAIKAVPQGVERSNIDPETLGKPLQDLALYEPCKPGGAKVKMRIAVWDGKAVGIDITTPNAKLADCIKGKLREITWEKKVKSLNTIEYQF